MWVTNSRIVIGDWKINEKDFDLEFRSLAFISGLYSRRTSSKRATLVVMNSRENPSTRMRSSQIMYSLRSVVANISKKTTKTGRDSMFVCR